MFFLTLLTFSPSLVTFEPCSLSEVYLDLPLYIRISQTPAGNVDGDRSCQVRLAMADAALEQM